MVCRRSRWNARGVRVQLLAVVATAGLLTPALAAEQTVTGTVAPQSIGVGLSGAASSPSSVVTTQQRGDTLYVTVSPGT